MNTDELAAGLEDIAMAQAAESALAGEEEPAEWAPSMDWLMGSVGPFFNNNQGIGELLLDKLMESGVNTEGVALAGLVNVLQQFSQEYKALGEAVGTNLDRINDLSSKSEDLAKSIQDVIKEMNVSKDEGAKLPSESDTGSVQAEALGGLQDALPDAGAAETAPSSGMDAGAPPAGGSAPAGAEAPPEGGAAPAPDAGAGAAPADTGAGAGAGGGAAPSPQGGMPWVTSDAGVKRILGMTAKELHGVLSDARMKRNARGIVGGFKKQASGSTRLSQGIIDSCKGDY